jgi:hypothetical protein
MQERAWQGLTPCGARFMPNLVIHLRTEIERTMEGLMSRIADAPGSFAIGAAIAIVLLWIVWKFVKGMAKTVLMIAIVVAVLAALVRMGKIEKPDALRKIGQAARTVGHAHPARDG